jgi:hypothetical protein
VPIDIKDNSKYPTLTFISRPPVPSKTLLENQRKEHMLGDLN